MDAPARARLLTAPHPQTLTPQAGAGEVVLVLALEGSGEFWHEGAEDTFAAGSLFVCHAGQTAALRCLSPVVCGQVAAPAPLVEGLWLEARAACGAAVPPGLPPAGHLRFSPSGLDVAKSCFALLYGAGGQAGATGAEVARLAFQALLTAVAGLCAGAAPATRGDLAEAVRLAVYQRYGQPLSLEELARENGVSVPYLSARFKRKTGVTFSAFLSSVRIQRAMALLAGTDDLVIDIADAVGFGSTSHFDMVFQRHTGMRPLQYRRLHRGGQG